MDQKLAKKLTESKMNSATKTLLFEIVRARNSVLSRTPGEDYFGTYTIYGFSDEYLKGFLKSMNKDGFWTKEIFREKDKNYVIYEISWKSEFSELPEGV